MLFTRIDNRSGDITTVKKIETKTIKKRTLKTENEPIFMILLILMKTLIM